MSLIGIINHGSANIKSLANAFSIKGFSYEIVSADVETERVEIERFDKLVIAGVGAFPSAMVRLHNSKLEEDIRKFFYSGKPLLGICLGMQLFFEKSYELKTTKGLGIASGEVVQLEQQRSQVQSKAIPRIGWFSTNQSEYFESSNSLLLQGIRLPTDLYYLHSFKVLPKRLGSIAAVANYHGVNYCAVYEFENLFGTQFHPEKSGEIGLQLLSNFAKL